MGTHEEGHDQRIQNKDEQEFEEMCGVVCEPDHPVRASDCAVSAHALG